MEFKDGMFKRRKALKWTQKMVSEKSGVPQSTVSAIESGARKPTEETMVQIARGLGCTVGELLGENKKTAAREGDGVKQEIITLLDVFPQEDLPQLRDYAAWLISHRGKQ